MKTLCLLLLAFAATAALGQSHAPPELFLDGSGSPFPAGTGSPPQSTAPPATCVTNVSGTLQYCNFAGVQGPTTNVLAFGAKPDGTTDNCTALTNASNAAAAITGGLLYFPPAGVFLTSCTVPFLSNWEMDGILRATTGGTAASTALVSTGISQTMDHKGIYGPGYIDSNSVAPTAVWVEQGHHINISVAGIIGIAANGKGVYFGDDAGVAAGGNEGYVYNTGFGLSSVLTAQAGSTAVYISGGNGTQGGFTDDNIHDNVLHGAAIGVVDHVGGNNYFVNNHIWDFALTTGEDEFGNGGTFTNEYIDTPTVYGIHLRGLLSRVFGGTIYNGTNGSHDNVATAIQFDQSAEPQAVVVGTHIYGNDVTHRFAADTNLGFSTALTTWCDLIEGNIATIQEGATTCIQGVKFSIFTGSQQMKFGTFSMGPTVITCSAACAFSSGTGTNIWVATLSQNATSTFVSTNPGSRIYTINICQPATGGPFTFAWPANSVGGGTIGTTASKCSLQEFQWDGTTLKAAGAIQINE